MVPEGFLGDGELDPEEAKLSLEELQLESEIRALEMEMAILDMKRQIEVQEEHLQNWEQMLAKNKAGRQQCQKLKEAQEELFQLRAKCAAIEAQRPPRPPEPPEPEEKSSKEDASAGVANMPAQRKVSAPKEVATRTRAGDAHSAAECSQTGKDSGTRASKGPRGAKAGKDRILMRLLPLLLLLWQEDETVAVTMVPAIATTVVPGLCPHTPSCSSPSAAEGL
eukprot:s894_g8.t1